MKSNETKRNEFPWKSKHFHTYSSTTIPTRNQDLHSNTIQFLPSQKKGIEPGLTGIIKRQISTQFSLSLYLTVLMHNEAVYISIAAEFLLNSQMW